MLKQAVSRVPVEQVVGRDFDLHRAGERYYRAVKHNSLVVDTEKNRWYWNSLGVSGNALDWLTKIRGYSVADSLEILQNYTKVPLRRSLDILFEPQLPYPKLLQAFYQLGKKKPLARIVIVLSSSTLIVPTGNSAGLPILNFRDSS